MVVEYDGAANLDSELEREKHDSCPPDLVACSTLAWDDEHSSKRWLGGLLLCPWERSSLGSARQDTRSSSRAGTRRTGTQSLAFGRKQQCGVSCADVVVSMSTWANDPLPLVKPNQLSGA